MPTLGGIACVAQNVFGSTFVLQYNAFYGSSGSLASQFIHPDNNTIIICDAGYGVSFSDPTPFILSQLNEIMFRTVLRVGAENTTDVQTTSGIMTYNETVFQSHYRYLASALLVLIVGMAAVLSTFWVWNEIGTTVSMSPLEIGRAFNAPLLRDTNAGADAKDLLKKLGGTDAQYGIFTIDGVRTLGIARPEEVQMPAAKKRDS